MPVTRLAHQTGDLELRPLPAVLLDLHEAGATGRFLVRRDRVIKTVDLVGGWLLAATAGDDTLGHFLVASGIIDQEQHRLAVARAAEHGSLADALLELGLLTPEKLTAQLAAQTRYRLLSPLRWVVGAWRFEEREPEVRGVKLSVPETVLAGLRDTAPEGQAPSQLLADTILELTPRGRRLLPLVRDVFAALVPDELPDGVTARRLIEQGVPAAAVDAMVLTDAVLPALPKVGPALSIKPPDPEPEYEPTSELYRELFGGPSMLISVPALLGTTPLDAQVTSSPFDDDDDEPIITIIEDEPPVDDATRAARDALVAESLRLRDLDHYQVLQVDPHADDLAISAALSERTSRFSRDYYARFQLGDAGDLLDEVHAAYDAAREVLLDDDRRRAYDRELAGGELADRGGEHETLRDAGLDVLRRGSWEVAAGKLEAAAALRPDDPGTLAGLGWAIWNRDGKTPDAGDVARGHLGRALRRAPNHAAANEYLGLVELALGADEQTALDHLERAARAGHADPHVLDAIAGIYLHRGQPRGLERLYRRLLRGGALPQVQGPVWHRLGVLYADHLDDPMQSRTAFGQAARLGHAVRPPRRIPSSRPAAPTDADFIAASLRLATGDDRAGDRELYDELRPRTLPRATATMTTELWNQLRHPHDEPDLGALAELLAPAAQVLHPITLADLGVDPSNRITDDNLPPAFASQQAYIAGLLGLPRVPVHAHPDFGDEVHVGACAQLTLLAGDDALTAPDRPELGYRIARATTYLWPGRAIGGSRPARVLRSLLLALARETSGPMIDRELAAAHAALAVLERPVREQARALVTRLRARAPEQNLSRWAHALGRTADRFGLLVSCDVPAAMRLAGDPTGDGGLVDFIRSPTFLALRRALGLGIGNA